MEPHDIHFDTSSPDHEDRPIIPAFIDNNRQALDFDCVGTVQNKVCSDSLYNIIFILAIHPPY